MIRGVHHLSLRTANFDRLVRFYCEAFHFEPVGFDMRLQDNPILDRITGAKNADARVTMLKAGNVFLEIFEWFAPAGKNNGPLALQDMGFTHFCVDVTDIEVEYKRLAEMGVVFTCNEPVTVHQYKTVFARDPDGNLIEVQQVPQDDIIALERLDKVSMG